MGLLLIRCFVDFLTFVLKQGLSQDLIIILPYPCIAYITDLPVFFVLPLTCRGIQALMEFFSPVGSVVSNIPSPLAVLQLLIKVAYS